MRAPKGAVPANVVWGTHHTHEDSLFTVVFDMLRLLLYGITAVAAIFVILMALGYLGYWVWEIF